MSAREAGASVLSACGRGMSRRARQPARTTSRVIPAGTRALTTFGGATLEQAPPTGALCPLSVTVSVPEARAGFRPGCRAVVAEAADASAKRS